MLLRLFERGGEDLEGEVGRRESLPFLRGGIASILALARESDVPLDTDEGMDECPDYRRCSYSSAVHDDARSDALEASR